MAVCSEINTKHINSQCGDTVKFLNDKPDCMQSNHWALKA